MGGLKRSVNKFFPPTLRADGIMHPTAHAESMGGKNHKHGAHLTTMKQLRAESAEYLRALIVSCNPIGPRMWLPMADALSRCSGWMPSMLLVAMFGTTMLLSVLIGQWINGPIAHVLNVVTWLTWGLVSCLAMSIGCIHSVRNLQRLGLRSVLRFRIWFELGRLSWHTAFLGFVVAATVSFVAGALNFRQVEPIGWSTGTATVESLLVVIAVTGTIGYAFAFARWRIPTGRAFECVNFFLPMASGFYLIVYAFDRWPPAAIWPDGIITALSSFRVRMRLGGSFTITVHRMRRWETRSEANTHAGGRPITHDRRAETPSTE